MWNIIIGIIILYIVFSIIGAIFGWIGDIFTSLSDLVGGRSRLIVIAILLIASYLLGSWAGVFALAALVAIGYVILSLLIGAGKFVGKQVEQHDERKKETALIKHETQEKKHTHDNDEALMNELSKNCYWLGYMNEEMWTKKLSNYANRQYSTDFKTITSNFAKQIEQQHILQNDDWFEPFKLYILNHPGGSTVTKMLHEVSCPQLKMTHSTPDGDLLNTWLVRGTKIANKDVPELFNSTFIQEMNESVFTPTPYLQKLYADTVDDSQEIHHVTEISFDDL